MESVRFDTSEKIETYAAFLGVVAWHIHWMTLYARERPHEEADAIFSKDDQELIRKTSIKPASSRRKHLTILDCVIYVAKLGVFLARKSDGLPMLLPP